MHAQTQDSLMYTQSAGSKIILQLESKVLSPDHEDDPKRANLLCTIVCLSYMPILVVLQGKVRRKHTYNGLSPFPSSTARFFAGGKVSLGEPASRSEYMQVNFRCVK